MQELTKRTINNTESATPVKRGCIDEHTCACGETHEQDSGNVRYRDTCTSPLKFGNSCCCQSDDAAHNAPHRCGHGPGCL